MPIWVSVSANGLKLCNLWARSVCAVRTMEYSIKYVLKGKKSGQANFNKKSNVFIAAGILATTWPTLADLFRHIFQNYFFLGILYSFPFTPSVCTKLLFLTGLFKGSSTMNMERAIQIECRECIERILFRKRCWKIFQFH